MFSQDWWARVVAGTSLSPSTNKASSLNNPEKRLARFRRAYSQLLQIWRSTSNLSQDDDALESVQGCVQELTSIISDESRRPSPHRCISFAAVKQIYVTVGKIATTSYDEPLIRAAIDFFSTLIQTEEEDFPENIAFSKSLMTLLGRITSGNTMFLNLETKTEVVGLAFKIATKIRDPEVLPAWFMPSTGNGDEEYRDEHEKFAGRTHKEDFPLLYLLIDEITEEGDHGDFARHGLLCIFQSASSSPSLEEWLVDSDLASLMASGLGALYGQLSRKLVIDYPEDEALPLILQLSDYKRPNTTREVVSSSSAEFQGQMNTFLSHVLFWQDVLKQCKSVEVKQTLLDHFRVIFIQQILYPSIPQSSDVDGGSSVAVLYTLRRILESLDHPDMIHLLLHYLLALPDAAPALGTQTPVLSAARKRKSMDLAAMMASQSEDLEDPTLFSLLDLILSCLRSKRQQSVISSLQLISTMLRKHHRYAVTALLRTNLILTNGPQKTIGAHEREVEFVLSLACGICENEDFDESYENHVKDSYALLESHQCSQALIMPKGIIGGSTSEDIQASVPGVPRDVRPHTLRLDDPIFKTILSMFETFFTNPVETNLCLTEAVVDLATCGLMHLDGWLLPDPSKYDFGDSEGIEDATTTSNGNASDSPEEIEAAQLRAVRLARRTPKWPPPSLPTLLTYLQTLVSQISTYRTEIPRFDDLLQQRRQALQPIPAEITPMPIRQQPRSSFDSSRSASPPPKPTAFDSLAQRIGIGLTSTPSRSSSPRGRRSQDQQRSNSGMSSNSMTPIANPMTSRIAPAQFPLSGATETPSRGSSRAFSASPLRSSENTPVPSRGLASQAAAFAEVDKAILARRVGMPEKKGEVVPVPFPNLSLSRDSSIMAGDTDAGMGSEEGLEDRDRILMGPEEGEGEGEEERSVSVSHVLTNVVVLQEFLLELAALVQVRAGLFGEVRFA